MPPNRALTDSQKDLVAVVTDAVGQALTPSPGESSGELERGKQLVQWELCDKEGPISKLRKELEKERLEREKTMKKAIALATFILAMVSGGIQIWGKVTARAEANAEMVQALRELRAEVKTVTSPVTQTTGQTK